MQLLKKKKTFKVNLMGSLQLGDHVVQSPNWRQLGLVPVHQLLASLAIYTT